IKLPPPESECASAMTSNPRTTVQKSASVACLVAGLVVTGGAVPVSAAPVPPPPVILGTGSGAAIPGQYIVAVKDTAAISARGIPAMARTLAELHGGKVGRVWDKALHG